MHPCGRKKRPGGFSKLKAFARFLRGRHNALDYRQQHAYLDICDIRLLHKDWNVIETTDDKDLKPLV